MGALLPNPGCIYQFRSVEAPISITTGSILHHGVTENRLVTFQAMPDPLGTWSTND